MNYKSNDTYTWKEEYGLPLETKWSRIAKFCFLNGLSWSYVENNKKLKNLIYHDYNVDFYYQIPDYMLNKSKNFSLKICPKCMKHGYHSFLHQIEGMKFCFLHKTSLIPISQEKVNASRDGTYNFLQIKTENLIQNRELLMLIRSFISDRESEGILLANIIFPRYAKWGIKECYKSTQHLFQKRFLNQNHITDNRVKCIKSICFENIDVENKKLANDFLNSYSKWLLQNDFYSSNYKFEEMLQHIKKRHIPSNSTVPYQLSEEVLGWCVMKIMLDIIEEIFDNYDDWEKTVLDVNRFSNNNLRSSKIIKYSVILAFEAITATTSFRNAVCINSDYWNHNANKCSFGLDVHYELGHYLEPYRLYGSRSQMKASQYTVFPIVKDLFEEISKQAYNMLKNGIIKLDPEQINKLTSDIWKVPQYEILYYNNRTEIYRCDPIL